ncbi:hypothetical protein D9611_005401 [Ephemerocybe angulata]|uniref:Uncharacterized protein n=1 Tax=Ephemerocybe angulata TaxID=980116 RepID=A0A8H5C0U0_9AGAR|nr:hypothetical protein D9611_005401 [Tulosesus angulatus]
MSSILPEVARRTSIRPLVINSLALAVSVTLSTVSGQQYSRSTPLAGRISVAFGRFQRDDCNARSLNIIVDIRSFKYPLAAALECASNSSNVCGYPSPPQPSKLMPPTRRSPDAFLLRLGNPGAITSTFAYARARHSLSTSLVSHCGLSVDYHSPPRHSNPSPKHVARRTHFCCLGRPGAITSTSTCAGAALAQALVRRPSPHVAPLLTTFPLHAIQTHSPDPDASLAGRISVAFGHPDGAITSTSPCALARPSLHVSTQRLWRPESNTPAPDSDCHVEDTRPQAFKSRKIGYCTLGVGAMRGTMGH